MPKLDRLYALNGICPYFTMFPLNFPYKVLKQRSRSGEWVLDPFCGRGTTNYASRILGLPSIGIDSSPVAAALSDAKLANTSPDEIVTAAHNILAEIPTANDIPTNEFWEWAYQKDVLEQLSRLRAGLLADCHSPARKALRGIILGGLHGPRGKKHQSYFSNQCQRTYAPKPGYAVKYWMKHSLTPQFVDVISIIRARAERYYSNEPPCVDGQIILGDSRLDSTFLSVSPEVKISWIITSPPYYGMRTYIPDQWLRYWFLGGDPTVSYTNANQLDHSGLDIFVTQLKQVWQNIHRISKFDARLVVRFGSLNDRKVDAKHLLRTSLADSGWKVNTVKSAGTALNGHRQAHHFSNMISPPKEEFDLWARRID